MKELMCLICPWKASCEQFILRIWASRVSLPGGPLTPGRLKVVTDPSSDSRVCRSPCEIRKAGFTPSSSVPGVRVTCRPSPGAPQRLGGSLLTHQTQQGRGGQRQMEIPPWRPAASRASGTRPADCDQRRTSGFLDVTFLVHASWPHASF